MERRDGRNNSYSANNGNRSNHHVNNYNGKNRSSGGFRISPTSEMASNHSGQHEELISYICESWEKATRESDRGPINDVRYFDDKGKLTNFTPFDLESLCRQRHSQNVKRPQHNS